MADSLLNDFVACGTNAERVAFTPSPPSPASGPTPGYFFFETDTGDSYSWKAGTGWVKLNTGGGGTTTNALTGNNTGGAAPGTAFDGSAAKTFDYSTFGAARANVKAGGRLTLTSGTPVLNADATAQTAIYYTPYSSDIIPIYDGTSWNAKTFTELTLTLDTTNHASGSLYDVFVWNNSGTISIGTGPAWSSGTARGTGAGTTELQMKNGIWTNKNSITLKNGAGAGTSGIAANTASYVGTFYATANGQTGMAFKPAAANGGCNNVLGLYNAYNRVRTVAMSRDAGTGTDYTYATTTWRQANNNANNRISWVDGLQQSSLRVANSQVVYNNAGAVGIGYIGTSLDSTTAAPGVSAAGGCTASSFQVLTGAAASENFAPQLGFHFLQRMETVSTGTAVFGVSATTPTRQNNSFVVELDM